MKLVKYLDMHLFMVPSLPQWNHRPTRNQMSTTCRLDLYTIYIDMSHMFGTLFCTRKLVPFHATWTYVILENNSSNLHRVTVQIHTFYMVDLVALGTRDLLGFTHVE